MPKVVPKILREARRRPPARTRSTQGGIGFLGGPVSQAGVFVTPETALNYASVFAAISIISTDCATLPTRVYRRTLDGGLDVDPNDPLCELLQVEGNGEVDAIHLIGGWYGDALREGNGYLEILRSPRDGRPLKLYRIAPRDCEPTRNSAGRLLYKLGNGKLLLPENVLHLKGFSIDGVVGVSIVARARQTIGLGTAAEVSASGMFGRGMNVSGFLKSKTKLKPEAQEELKAYLSGEYSGPYNAGKPGMLVGDYEWIQMGLSAADGQFLATRAFNVIEICRWFNINPIKLMDYSNGRFSNIEQAQNDHLSTTLMPWLIFGETELNRKLLTRADRQERVIFNDVDARLRGDSATRWGNYQKAFGMGVLSQNEIRVRENLNPFDGGDRRYFPSNNFTEIQAAGARGPSDPSNQGEEPTRSQGSGPDPINDPARVPRDWEARSKILAVDSAIESMAP